ncbi:pilus assembly PilX family protein [Psychromonas sp. Urea-02u-13]|uniref:pilus assembly PilX family protein n=1 Tax=Psychromonas sp. Urea-02u-13 TaxID=2058326 RepID=UPI000C337B61|nr:pilus assembly PilX N-terminal domain-containing protein [Psychromonas sp. Urea-02u-13]PKG40775.1 hypothetical protein CXF74_01160 [Psychromonas sp. Urea-02u-13]
MKKSQNGFVLISVLLITTVSTLYTFSEIKGNQLQERIGGNQQKEMNARAMAEKGVFKAFEYIETENIPGASSAILTSAINNGFLNAPQMTVYSASVDTNNIFTFISKGENYDSVAYFKAKIHMKGPQTITEFPDAIVGCEGINIEGALVDSYNGVGNLGPYTSGSTANNADIATISDTSEINIGNGTVQGSVTSNGSVDASSGTSNITGDVSAQTNIKLKDGFSGNTHAGGDTTIENFTINGGLNTYNDLKYYGTRAIDGQVTHGGLLQVGNENNPYQDSTATLGAGTSHVKNGKPQKMKGDCDTKGIVKVIDDMKTGTPTGANMSTMVKDDGTALSTLTFSDDINVGTNAHLSSGSGSFTEVQTVPMDLSTLGFRDTQTAQAVYVFDSLELVNQDIEISGDVVFLVKGDIELGNGGTGFKFKTGEETTSSLTIITDSKITIGAAAAVFPNSAKLNDTGNAPLSVYSSFQSVGLVDDAYNSGFSDARQNVDSAFLVTGAANMYVNIHAPLGYVQARASGEIYGAMRGKAVDVIGDIGIHYDEKLGSAKSETLIGTETTFMLSSYYHYPL